MARTGAYPGGGPAQLAGIKWAFDTHGPIIFSAAIAGEIAYVSSLSGSLHAIDAASGKGRWHFKSNQPIASTPAVADGAVHFVSSAGSLVALDAMTGQTLWVFVAGAERKFEARNLRGYPSPTQTIPDAWDLYTSSPAVTAGKVVFGSGDGNVYAVDQHSGVLQW